MNNQDDRKSGLEAVWRRFRSRPRYWLVVIAAVVIGLYGQASTPHSVVYPGGYANPLWTADRSLRVEQSEQRFTDVLSSAAGDYWKVFIDLRADLSEPDRSGLPSPTSEMLGVWLRSPSGAEQLIGKVEVPVAKDFTTYEFTVKTETNFRDLIVRREDSDSRALVMMNQPQLVRLNVASDAELATLHQTTLGSTKVSVVDETVNPDNEIALARLGLDSEVVGQIFQAKSALLSGVGVKLQRSGNGGIGTYQLGVYEVQKSGDKYSVASSPVASLQFSAAGAFQYYSEQPGGYEIHFPLIASLKPGGLYLIGFTAVDLREGTLNSLSLVGDTKSLNTVEWPALRVADGQTSAVGQAYLQVYTAQLGSVGDSDWPAGARVVDLGRGEGIFSYQKNNSLAGAFNLHNLSSVANKIAADNFISPTNVPLDQDLIYQLDTVYPFQTMHLRLSPTSSDAEKVSVGLYYSYDQQDWRLLEADKVASSEGTLDQTLTGDGQHHRVYIKAVGTATEPVSQAWFGLGEMQVTAGLIIK